LFAPERATPPQPADSIPVEGAPRDVPAVPSPGDSADPQSWFDPTSEIRVIPVDHDPFSGTPQSPVVERRAFELGPINPHAASRSDHTDAEPGATHLQTSQQPVALEPEINARFAPVNPQATLTENAFKADPRWNEHASSRLTIPTARPGFGYID